MRMLYKTFWNFTNTATRHHCHDYIGTDLEMYIVVTKYLLQIHIW